MFSILLLTLVISCSGHQITHEFVSIIVQLGQSIGMESAEVTRISAAAFSAGLISYDTAASLPVPSGCPQSAELAAAYTMYTAIKGIAGFTTYTEQLNNKFNAIVQSRPCDPVSLETIRQAAFLNPKAEPKLYQLLDDQFISFYLPVDERPGYLSAEIKAELSYNISHFAYSGLVCFDADAKDQFPSTPCPNVDSLVVASDWAHLLANGNVNNLTPTQNLTSQFWNVVNLGDAYDSAYAFGSIFLLSGRQLIERQCGNDLRKELQQYTLLTTSLLNTVRTIYRHQFYFNSYPILKLMTQPVHPPYPYNPTFKSLFPSNFPTYPILDASFVTSFITFAKTLVPNQALRLTVYSDSMPSRYYADYQALYDDYYNGIYWGGVAFRFAFDAAKDLAEKATSATISQLLSGKCPLQYAN